MSIGSLVATVLAGRPGDLVGPGLELLAERRL
jgi:hypothetical protein